MFQTSLCLLLFSVVATSKLNPECWMNTPQLIKHTGFPVQSHFVTTSDGYILNLFRIPPKSPNSPVIFLQHGFAGSSDTWLLNGGWGSFAFIASNAGYDVWLGNIRGNIYSINHTTIPVDSDRFWDFSFQEMAEIDLPAMIDKALNISGMDKLFYVGHSQGSEIGFIGFSQSRQLAKKINMFVAMGPIARLTHIKGLLSLVSQSEWMTNMLLKHFGKGQILLTSPVSKILKARICTKDDILLRLCENLTALIGGFDISNINQSRYDILESHTGDSTSAKNIVHWLQIHKAGEVQQFDYGHPKTNQAHYNQTTPPIYNISTLGVPTVLVTGGEDWLADPRDVLWLTSTIKPFIHKVIFINKYNHFDYIGITIDAKDLVYRPVLQMMKKLQRL